MTKICILYFTLLIKSAVLYSQSASKLYVRGKIAGANNGTEIKLFKFKENRVEYLSSTLISNERFEFDNVVEDVPVELYLQFNGAKSSPFAVVYLDKTKAEIQTSIAEYPNLIVSGSDFHSQYLEYQKLLDPLQKKKYRLYKEKELIKYGDSLTASRIEFKFKNLEKDIQNTTFDFINHHPNWFFTPILIMQLYNNSFELKREYGKLNKEVKNSKVGIKLREKIIHAEMNETKMPLSGYANSASFTITDTLRGSITKERNWWNVLRYDLSLKPDYSTKTIFGTNKITFRRNSNNMSLMQIDLQEPLKIDSVKFNQIKLPFFKSDSAKYVWYINVDDIGLNVIEPVISIYYSGSPHIALNPPWNGGWIWSKDKYNRPWISVTCQAIGASIWYPCKDHQSDEPDNGISVTLIVPDTLVGVSNGRLIRNKVNSDSTVSWTWEVKNPINNYNVAVYIGKYVNWRETFSGEKGPLECDYWILDYNLEKAKTQFSQVKFALKCFENWFGPYPFYEDSYKLCDAPFAGMEHQSAIAYGSHFINGYPTGGGGSIDLSNTGWGLSWDYILVHESGHEWFGNSITTNDIADMWVQEGFTDYSETLFIESIYGKKAADAYNQGLRKTINNDKPIIGPYGVNKMGSGDMYAKGATLIHMVRTIINDDKLFRSILRALNDTFRYKTVDTKEIEDFITRESKMNFSRVFDQYLRTIKIPILEYKIKGTRLFSRWANCVTNFDMPVKLENSNLWLYPTTKWHSKILKNKIGFENFLIDKNFYIQSRKL